MKKEIATVVFFLKRLIKKAEKLDEEKVDLFVERLAVALQKKYKGHWYPDNPSKGQAFRCIRVNCFQREDAELLRACAESGVQYKDLGLPKELTLWVDPGEVCCRYGENTYGFTVATFSSDDDDDDKEHVTKTVASAVEWVTSDYHSGSSSDEDTSCREIHYTPALHNQPPYQLPYASPPVWHPIPRKKFGPGKHNPQRPHYMVHPPCRPNHSFKAHSWDQQGYHGKPGFCGSKSNQLHQLK